MAMITPPQTDAPDARNTSPRLFFALWPDEQVRREIAALRNRMAQDYCGRQTRADTLHLTLLFLGNIPDLRVPTLLACGDRVRSASFHLTLDACNHFNESKVAWLGATEPPAALAELHHAVRREAAADGFDGAHDTFVPHVTMARHCKLFPAPRAIPAIDWNVQDFVLIDVRPTPGGPVYRVLRHWPLQH